MSTSRARPSLLRYGAATSMFTCWLAGCFSSSDEPAVPGANGGAALDGEQASSGAAGAGEGGAGNARAGEGGAAAALAGAAGTGAAGTGGQLPGDSGGWENEGQCYFEGSGVYSNGAYEGSVAFLLYSEPFGDVELCRVEFDVTTVGSADPECDFCYFSTVVGLSNPVVVIDVDDACANSERALGPDAVAQMVAAPPVAIGFAAEGTGHGEVLVQYDPARENWAEVTFGSFDPDTGELLYDKNDGFCRY